jgi:hypothetical protein
MVLLPLCYGAETTQIWCYHHSNLSSPNYQYGITTTQIWWYHHFNLFNFSSNKKILKQYLYTVKIFLNSHMHYCFKRDYDLKSTFLFRRDIRYRRDCVFKTFLNSEGTLYRLGTKVLRTLLFPKGQKKEMRRRIGRQHKLEEEERKSSWQLNRNYLV